MQHHACARLLVEPERLNLTDGMMNGFRCWLTVYGPEDLCGQPKHDQVRLQALRLTNTCILRRLHRVWRDGVRAGDLLLPCMATLLAVRNRTAADCGITAGKPLTANASMLLNVHFWDLHC